MNRRILFGILIALAFLAVYLTGIRRIGNEKSLRSLELTDEVTVADHLRVEITITNVDLAKGQLMARLRMRPSGRIASEFRTPSVKLKLYVNNSPGQQEFEFPVGQGMTRIEATFPLDGDLNRYPFDRYESNIWLYADTPPPPKAPQVSQVTHDNAPLNVDNLDVAEAELALDRDSLQKNLPVPLSISLSASTSGVKYTGEIIRVKDSAATRVHLNLTRPFNVINNAISVMGLMIGLALSVVAMVINRITSRDTSDLLPLSLSISLIFGLPALRSIQPGVPSVGVLGDYFSFIWAELFVAASAIIMIWTWLLRSLKSKTTSEG
ncbi:MAG: DUF4436 family protein [Edaphobacter sp.]